MEIIYIDRLFLIIFFADLLLITGTARVCGLRLRQWRYLLASLLGACCAVLCVLPETEFFALMPVKLAEGALTALIAFGGEKRFIRTASVFFGISAFFGGAVWLLGGRGGTVVSVSLRAFIFAFGISYSALALVFSRSVKRAERKCAELTVLHKGKTLRLHTLYDSGSSLHDPISGDSVIVCSPSALKELYPELPCPAQELLMNHSGEFRFIPYTAVGTEGGLLPAFRPEQLYIDGRERGGFLLAVSTSELCKDFDSVMEV